MIDPHYQPIYQQAAAAQNMFHIYTKTMAHDPQATVMRNEIHKLTNDLAANRNPRAVEQRVRTIQSHLERMQRTNPGVAQALPLNSSQSQRLHQNFEAMRRNVITHPKF